MEDELLQVGVRHVDSLSYHISGVPNIGLFRIGKTLAAAKLYPTNAGGKLSHFTTNMTVCS